MNSDALNEGKDKQKIMDRRKLEASQGVNWAWTRKRLWWYSLDGEMVEGA